ncbi:MAG: alpha/beta hydrolase [Eubacteriales bacterium]
MKSSVYQSAEKKATFRAVYHNFLSAMPFAKRTIDTPFGETFLLEAGDPTKPAVVLLHGSCSNSAFWFNDIMALMNDHHVFAADIPGEAGNSSEYRLSLDNADYADWMASVLDALNLPRANIAGNSLGGWMALKFATTYPTRVEKLVLFASGGLAPSAQTFWSAQAAEESEESLTFDENVAGDEQVPKEILDFINLILDSYYPLNIPMPLFDKEQLQRLTMPVLYVAGLKDELLDSSAGETALRAGVPHAEIHMLPESGHMITTPFVWMLPFLAK